ncbi:MAG TPA: Rieske (2Fe-2S) protein [Caulobacteraceae bacterium]
MSWTDVMGVDELAAKGKAVIRKSGVQVLLIHGSRGVFACVNRCPHEGYPLSEGVLTDGCVLTCNWHNWKYDLISGETLVGGDRLRRFPTRIEGGRVLVDLTPEDPAVRRERALAGIRRALADEDQARLVREAARLMRLGVDAGVPVTEAVAWASERLEFGTQHGIAGAAEWLAVHDARATNPDRKLATIGEILGHLADDARGGGKLHPFPAGQTPWDPAQFLAAIESEEEAGAMALIRGGLAAGLGAHDFLPTLARAALSHYADFGHALIYTVKTCALIERLGPASAEPLLLMLTRSLVYMTREDLLPEFRDYGARLAEWGRPAKSAPKLEVAAVAGFSPRRAMAVVASWSGREQPEAVFAVLVEAAAWMLLHADEAVFLRVDGKRSDNVNWLDFTHALTFADAGRNAARAAPDLMPALLLQLACFIGRNGAYVDPSLDGREFAVRDPRAFEAEATERLFDHGLDRFIISVHLIKTLRAGMALAKFCPAAAPTIHAALNRFLAARFKRRHVLRTARQMRAFVALE